MEDIEDTVVTEEVEDMEDKGDNIKIMIIFIIIHFKLCTSAQNVHYKIYYSCILQHVINMMPRKIKYLQIYCLFIFKLIFIFQA